ncbi:MAG: hypothetical protein M3P85_12580 [Actinomycetota bacterium]|nr:hypothetical protein [Actinomycetota bacterium]
MLLAYQSHDRTSTGSLDADPRSGWRNLFVDEIDDVVLADPASLWQTADNYNPSHPFNAIDHLCVAVTVGDPTDPVRQYAASAQKRPLNRSNAKPPASSPETPARGGCGQRSNLKRPRGATRRAHQV